MRPLVVLKIRSVEPVSAPTAVAATRRARLVRYATMMGCVFLVAVMMRDALKDNFAIKRTSVRLVVESTTNVLRDKLVLTTAAKMDVAWTPNVP